jgi:hypothetical protein
MLSKPPPIHLGTSDVIPRLHQWAPEIAAKLSEKEKTTEGISFRLITQNEIWFSENVDSFAAVSYCWQDS